MTMRCSPVAGQQPEAHVHRLGEPDAVLDGDVRLDAVLDLGRLDLETGDKVGADDLVAVDLEVRHVVAPGVTAEFGDRVEQAPSQVDGAHIGSFPPPLPSPPQPHSDGELCPAMASPTSPASGMLVWSQGMQRCSK